MSELLDICARQIARADEVESFHARHVVWCTSHEAEQCFEDCAALITEVQKLKSALASSRQDLEEAVRALESFAKVAEFLSDDMGGQNELDDWGCSTFKDCRRAREIWSKHHAP